MTRHKDHELYSTWRNMRNRCLRPHNKDYKNYGGRGIRICERWDDFKLFVADMGPRPLGCTLERNDNDGPYSPDNCRWATYASQRRNSRQNHFIAYDGRTQCLQDWAEEFGICQSALCLRIRKYGETRAMQMGEKIK